jgi:hypothetical protein
MKRGQLLGVALGLVALLSPWANSAVLPDDRADLLYHRYDGGGVVIQGPSILVRKKFGEQFALSGNYYVDMITSASIDVVTTASPYKERRDQKSLSAEYLRGKSIYSASYTTSEENDYEAETASLGVSHDLFGDLTTISLGFSRGWDTVGKRGEPDFLRDIDRRNYRVGVSQVLTRNMLLALNFETITEEGYLQNPYRTMRYRGPTLDSYTRAPEVFPNTRTGNAGSARLKYHLPWRAAIEGQYRFYSDSWGINAHTAGLEYTQPIFGRWTVSGSYRYYKQSSADFYSDLFPRANFQNFMVRDKENATYVGHTVGIGATYDIPQRFLPFLKKGTVNLQYNRMMVDYEDFRDLTLFPPGSATPGTEPLYTLDADIIQFYLSFWF